MLSIVRRQRLAIVSRVGRKGASASRPVAVRTFTSTEKDPSQEEEEYSIDDSDTPPGWPPNKWEAELKQHAASGEENSTTSSTSTSSWPPPGWPANPFTSESSTSATPVWGATPAFSQWDWMRRPITFGSKRQKFFQDNGVTQEELKESLELQKKFFDWMFKELLLKDQQQWYLINNRELDRHGGKELVDAVYEGSLSSALEAVYPDHTWHPWRFPKIAANFWDNKEHHKQFFEWLSKHLRLKNLDGWYGVHVREIQRNGGRGLLAMFDNDICTALKATYPEHRWDVWRFGYVPAGYWDNPENLKEFFLWAQKDLKLRNLDGWYKIHQRDIDRRGGQGIIEKYKKYIGKALADAFPEKNWEQWRFQDIPAEFWDDTQYHRKYFDSLMKDLNLKTLESWYHVSKSDVSRHGGGGPLPLHYDNQMSKALMTLYPEHNWVIWRFSKVPEGFWDQPENRKAFFEWLAKELKVKDMDGWYRVTRTSVARFGGSALMAQNDDSLPKTLMAVFPEHEWNIWRFQQTPKDTWSDIGNQRAFFDWMGKKMGMRDLTGWYSINKLDLIRYGGRGLMGLHNHHLSDALMTIYADHPWEPWRFWKVPTGFWDLMENQKSFFDWYTKKRQFVGLEGWYEVTTKDLENNGGKELMPRYSGSVAKAVEAIYPEHTWETFRFKQASDGYWSVDPDQTGMKLSFIQKVALRKPDLLKEPMPGTPGVEFEEAPKARRFTYNEKRALIGSAFALGVDWNEKDDPTGWWMTEKLDGVRVMWDGEKLFSRSGLALKLPRFFTQALPKLYLDCELWIGRQRGDDIAHLCRTAKPTDDTDEWDEVTLVVFDIPEFSDYPYEERMKVLDSLQLGTYARAIERRKCESREDLQQYLLDIVSKGGEGIMLRKPGSPYAIGRTDAMVKVKHFTEAEVQIVGTYPRNRTLLCEQADTNICTVYCSPEVFTHPPKNGSVLTIRHAGIKQTGKYKYPFFVRERFDLSWDQVRSDWFEQERKKQEAATPASEATPATPATPTTPSENSM